MLRMSSTLVEPPGTGIAPPLRPSVWQVGWATFLGYFLTLLVGLPISLLLSGAGIDVWGDGRGVFHAYDVWSWLAEAFIGVLATFVTAYFVSDSLRRRTGWEVPFSFAFATLLLTGYAPLLALTPFYWAAAPVSLVAAALLLRWRAAPAGAEPLKLLGAVPRRYRQRVAIALTVAGPLMFAYVIAYGATHPLHWGYGGDDRPRAHKPGKLMRYELSLENGGPSAVSDISVVRVEGSPVLQLERVGLEDGAGDCVVPEGRQTCAAPLRPLGDYRLNNGIGRGAISLELRQGRLCPPGIAKLDAVWLRYTVFGGRHEQRIPLENPPQVRCP
jgi:hypothetical protein